MSTKIDPTVKKIDRDLVATVLAILAMLGAFSGFVLHRAEALAAEGKEAAKSIDARVDKNDSGLRTEIQQLREDMERRVDRVESKVDAVLLELQRQAAQRSNKK